MSRRFPHRLRITRPGEGGGGSQNDDGEWVPDEPGGETLLYDELADVQDGGATVRRDAVSGVPVETADAAAFLRDANRIALVRRGDTAVVRWEDGTEQDAEVVGVVRLDAKVLLSFL